MFINNVLINNNGCHINRCCVSCIMYADDLMLLSSSVSGLQKLLDICVMTAKELCLQFNERKSHCIAFGPRYQCKVVPMYLCDKPNIKLLKTVSLDLVTGFVIKICHHLSSRTEFNDNSATTHLSSYKVVPNINLFGSLMIHWILS